MVSSPGAQESLWPRTRIQARISGDRAPAIKSHRRMGKVSNPVQLKSFVPQIHACCSVRVEVWVSAYQGRKSRLMITMIDAAPPSNTLFRSRREKSIGASLTEGGNEREGSS